MRWLTTLYDYIIERFTKFITVIQSDHNYIHQGIGFSVVGETGSLSAGATYKLEFLTPTVASGKYVHWRPVVLNGYSAGVNAKIYKSSTAVTPGAATTILNMNQNSSKTSDMQSFTLAPTVTEGTLFQIIAGGSAGAGSVNRGGGGAAELERILIPNTQYSILITNLSGSTATNVGYEFFWYEEGEGV